jgi:gamma-glutamyl phosphate reductase
LRTSARDDLRFDTGTTERFFSLAEARHTLETRMGSLGLVLGSLPEVALDIDAAPLASVNSVFIRGENDIIHGHTPREGISRPIYL